MYLKKVAYVSTAILFGTIFTVLNIPVGWLLGAIIFGIICRIFFSETFALSNRILRIGMALIGCNIGLRIEPSFFLLLTDYFFPLLISISLTMVISYILSKVLFKYSSLDYKTCFFCCVPGGASEVIGMSQNAGADERIVAAFHSTRILFFVLLIPLIVTTYTTVVNVGNKDFDVSSFLHIPFINVLFVLIVLGIALLLAKVIKLPVGTLIYAIVVSSFLNYYYFDITLSSPIVSGLGQGFIGAVIGLKFSRETFRQLKESGWISITVIGLLFIGSLFTAYIFMNLSSLNYFSSLLGTVPAGAAEMSSVAYSLDLDPSIVATFQTVRLLSIFLLLPVISNFLFNRRKSES